MAREPARAVRVSVAREPAPVVQAQVRAVQVQGVQVQVRVGRAPVRERQIAHPGLPW